MYSAKSTRRHEKWVGSKGMGDGCGLKFRYPVDTAHISMTDSELREELQLLVRLMRMNGTASYLYCIYLYDYLFPLQHLTQWLHPVSI